MFSFNYLLAVNKMSRWSSYADSQHTRPRTLDSSTEKNTLYFASNSVKFLLSLHVTVCGLTILIVSRCAEKEAASILTSTIFMQNTPGVEFLCTSMHILALPTPCSFTLLATIFLSLFGSLQPHIPFLTVLCFFACAAHFLCGDWFPSGQKSPLTTLSPHAPPSTLPSIHLPSSASSFHSFFISPLPLWQ